jgi:N6-adenosine-specific RNA methylase IME4
MQKKYKVLYADPPWHWQARSPKGDDRNASQHYNVMSLDGIKQMRPQIDAWSDKDCVLLMWATMPMLPQALEVMTAWGYRYKTCGFTWLKINSDGAPFSGLGYWTRANAELCLLGTRGNPTRKAKDVPQAVMAARGRHSAKPAEIRKRIERLLDGPYLELFARERADGWDSYGEEL